MLQLQLSDVKVGTPQNPQEWSNHDKKYVDVDPKQHFLTKLGNNDLLYVDSNLPDVEVYHRNYIEYLEKCWAEHLGIVVTPDIFWYTLLCEISSLVKSDHESYRHLFSTSSEKQNVIVMAGGVHMPLSELTQALRSVIPTDSEIFFPDFTTSGQRSRHAFRAAFCDMCSPYYDYSVLLCGFPAIDIRGTEDDYALMSSKWRTLSKLFKNSDWFARVQNLLDKCVNNLTDRQWWSKMFSLEECGSGHQVSVNGWFSEFFIKRPSVRYPENFPSCVSIVDYKHLNLDKFYRMQDGLMFSKMEGDFLVPNFGFAIHEKVESSQEKP